MKRQQTYCIGYQNGAENATQSEGMAGQRMSGDLSGGHKAFPEDKVTSVDFLLRRILLFFFIPIARGRNTGGRKTCLDTTQWPLAAFWQKLSVDWTYCIWCRNEAPLAAQSRGMAGQRMSGDLSDGHKAFPEDKVNVCGLLLRTRILYVFLSPSPEDAIHRGEKNMSRHYTMTTGGFLEKLSVDIVFWIRYRALP
ncbi:hypothetical protein CEXT_720941 [Caerostris extrusa]|uniref:Uncharacterized protein n=1 Tax=Caerostris extrusa TaxID=172846 RepID=A0AAV4M7S4_CAEEX|nr:hypothetical protein CEXT_720941 [Caerostris extrusa]